MALRDYRLDNLPRSTQLAIVAGLIVCLAFLFYLYVIKDLLKERSALDKEIVKLEVSVAKMTAVESQLNQFKQKLAELEKRLTMLRSILPAEKETPTVLRSVQQMAVSSNLKILKFTPQPVITRDFYSDWPINIEVEGSYNGLGTFFEKVGRSTRIIDVGTISIKNINNSMDPKLTLTANCTATTFVYRENQPEAPVDTTAAKKKEKKR
jgi:type IV pilus assembly protein PilO